MPPAHRRIEILVKRTTASFAFAIPFASVANKSKLERGLHVVISGTVCIPPKSVDSAIKNFHWLDLVKGFLTPTIGRGRRR